METKLRILIAVKPEPLSRIIAYLLGGVSDIEILACVNDTKRIVRHAERILPNLIIVNDTSIGPDSLKTIEALKNASPGTKVVHTFWRDSADGDGLLSTADSRLDEASLTEQLVPTVRRLCAPRKDTVAIAINHQEYQ